MSRTSPQKPDFRARAEAGWSPPPDWVLALADEAQRTSLTATGKRIGYSGPTLSQTISNSYPGDLKRIEEMVRGALMSAKVDCPILGRIGRDRCLEEQVQPFRSTSAMRAQLFHACRGGCPHSKHTKGEPNVAAEGEL